MLTADTLRIEIADTGMGINAEVLPRLFQPFVQADNSVSARFGGSGLGLYISRRLIELMGGSINAHSETGKGSSFTIHLPLLLPEETDVPSRMPGTSLMQQCKRGGTVLVVDDSEVNRRVALLLLKKLGLSATLVTSGQAAIDTIKDKDFDLILMDCQMPGMDGFQTSRQIRQWEQQEDKPRHKIIAVTALALDDDRKKCFESGMDAYLTKPIDQNQLRETIDRLFD
jgi:CheY-like chemotaxis protein